jgi:AcrR family transcriptional regulator
MVTQRSLQKEQTRQKLLLVAREAFNESGFEGTTIRAIAKRAGVATGTVFVHFPDKHAILAEIFHSDLEVVLAEAWASLPPRPFRKQLLHLAGQLYGYYARHPKLSRVLIAQSIFMEGAPGERLHDQLDRFLERVGALASEAASRGEIDAELTPGVVVRLFFSSYFAVLLEGLATAPSSPDEWVEDLKAALGPWLARAGGTRRRTGKK